MKIVINIEDTIAESLGTEEVVKGLILTYLKSYTTEKIADNAAKVARENAILSVSDIDEKIK